MRVTQRDIARLACVSQATVSRVLAGDERVEDELRQRVVEVMRENNYQVDVTARALRMKSTGLIGLVVKRPHGGLGEDPFFSNLIAEILDVLSGQPYHLCLDAVSSELGQESIYDEMLRTRRVDGLILVESEARDARIARLNADHFPFVLIGNPQGIENLWSVDNDNVHAGRLATEHLIQSGYKHIGFLAGPKGLTVTDDRVEGYRQAMYEADRPVRVWHSEFGFDAAQETAKLALRNGDKPDALVVLDDYMAMGVVSAARELRISIPNQLGLVSFNDTKLCTMIDGGLSSVSLNISSLVSTAVTQLMRVLEKRPTTLPYRRLVPVELVVRGSSRGPGGAA